MGKAVTAINDKLKDAEARRGEDEARYQREKREADEKIKELETRGQRRGGTFLQDLVTSLVPTAAPIITLVDGIVRSTAKTQPPPRAHNY